MRHSIGLALVAGFLVATAAPLSAQTELQRASEIVKDWQTAPRVETTRKTTVVVPQREILVIDRVRARHGWWRNPSYQVITVYYDGRRFYRLPFDRRPLRKVVVYRRGSRYYIDEVQWRREHRLHYGRDYRWNDDDRWRDDDGRKHDDDHDGRKGNNGLHLGHDKDKHKDKDRDRD